MIKYIASDLDGTLLHNGAQQLRRDLRFDPRIEIARYTFIVQP